VAHAIADNTVYGHEFATTYAAYLECPLRVAFGDNTAAMATPTVVKTRRVGDTNGVLLPLNRKRHWNHSPATVAVHDRPWSAKRMDVVWRGATTGKSRAEDFNAHPRTRLVRKWGTHHRPRGVDVAYSKVVQNKHQCADMVGRTLSMAEQLEFALIISVEGNDVASNLKWILASNSAPVMPPPRYESWLLESALVPLVHYIPVRPDFADLEDVLAWCRAHRSECNVIACNGQAYIAPFFESRAERELERAVLDRYLGRTVHGPYAPSSPPIVPTSLVPPPSRVARRRRI
jgi:hypothetical protein